MTPDQVMNAATKYSALLYLQGASAVRTDTSMGRLDTYQKLCHTLWMCGQIQAFVGLGGLDKANRWLGFVQGAMWSFDLLTIDEMREDNRP